jgi:hypothetical protein
MTRKDYELIAAHLNTGQQVALTREERDGYLTATLRLCRALAADNPRFNQTTFLDAAGFPQ